MANGQRIDFCFPQRWLSSSDTVLLEAWWSKGINKERSLWRTSIGPSFFSFSGTKQADFQHTPFFLIAYQKHAWFASYIGWFSKKWQVFFWALLLMCWGRFTFYIWNGLVSFYWCNTSRKSLFHLSVFKCFLTGISPEDIILSNWLNVQLIPKIHRHKCNNTL